MQKPVRPRVIIRVFLREKVRGESRGITHSHMSHRRTRERLPRVKVSSRKRFSRREDFLSSPLPPPNRSLWANTSRFLPRSGETDFK